MIKLVDVYSGTGVTPGAIEFLYKLIEQRMTEPEVNISATMPTPEQHRQFVHRRPYRYWYLIDAGIGVVIDTNPPMQHPVLVGYISATDRNEIGVVLLKEFRRRGFARAAITEFMLLHEPMRAEPSVRRGEWLANINPANEASKALFRSLGFTHLQETYALQRGEDHGNKKA